MSIPKTAIILDTRRKKQNDLYPVKLRVTFERKQVYYQTPYDLTEQAFKKVMFGERLTDKEKELKRKIIAFEDKATSIIDTLPYFSWQTFDKKYLANRAAKDTVKAAFEDRIIELKEGEQISTAISYECAKNSLDKFAPNAKFVDFTPGLLTKYEKEMLNSGNSKTTISMYLRSLRSIFNIAITNGNILPALYPFRRNEAEKDKYEIPEGSNIKKALDLAEIETVFNYKTEYGTFQDMAKDYWIFIYLTSGLNVKDLCLLRYKNIDGDTLKFIRAKTVKQKKEKIIQAILHPETKAIIEKWGNRKKDGNTFIFPVLKGNETPEKQRQLIQQLTQVINNNMKVIAEKLTITKPISTMAARHSFATVLKRSGASIELISEMLGHSNSKTTKNYLASFESETLKHTTKALTAFKKLS